MKLVDISSPYSLQWLRRFPVATMPKAQRGRDRDMDTVMENPVAHGQPTLLCSIVRLKQNKPIWE